MESELTTIPKMRRVFSDVYADLPVTGLNEEDLAYATDRLVFYRWDGAAWQPVTIHSSSGLAADIPAAADLPNGSLYYQTDTSSMHQVQAGAWVDITPVSSGVAVFGDGSDGDVTTAGGGAGDVTLTRDMFYNNLTVTAGDTITTGGFRIFVKETLTNNGTIERNGKNAVNNTAGNALVAGSLGIGEAGGTTFIGSGAGGGGGGVLFIAAKIIDNSSGIISANGGDGGIALGGGGGNNPGGAGTNIVTSLGDDGGVGGSTTGQVGGAIGSATVPTAVMGGFRAIPFIIILKEVETTVVKINGGAGGGGGAQDAANNEFGGGGGGGGGYLVLIYNTLIAGTETANGGVLGTGNGGGDDGAAGVAGVVVKLINA